jgi:hypothetical protein
MEAAAAAAAENNFVVDDLLALLYDDDAEGGGEAAVGDGEAPPCLQPCSAVDNAHGVREEGGHEIFSPTRRNVSAEVKEKKKGYFRHFAYLRR